MDIALSVDAVALIGNPLLQLPNLTAHLPQHLQHPLEHRLPRLAIAADLFLLVRSFDIDFGR
jgi:hypothetical protein